MRFLNTAIHFGSDQIYHFDEHEIIYSIELLIYSCILDVLVLVFHFLEYGPVEVPPAPLAVQSFDGSGPRLMITHIVNENFKSYANSQTLGPFHKVVDVKMMIDVDDGPFDIV